MGFYPPFDAGDPWDAVATNLRLQALSDAIQGLIDGDETLADPVITDFSAAQHDHSTVAAGGPIPLSSIVDEVDNEAADNQIPRFNFAQQKYIPGDDAGTPLTTKGDILTRDSSTYVRLPVGTNGHPIVADSSQSSGLKYGGMQKHGMQFMGCRLYHSANQAIGSGASVTLTWDSEFHDTNTFHSTSSNPTRITIPSGAAGLYKVNMKVYQAAAASLNWWLIELRKNGSTVDQARLFGGSSGSVTFAAFYAPYISLVVGDYIEMRVSHSIVGSASTLGGNSGEFSEFGVEFQGVAA